MAGRQTSVVNNVDHPALIQALIEDGWRGEWHYTSDGKIALDNNQGSLCTYLKEHRHLDYFQAIQLVLNLGTQVVALAKLGKGLVSINCDDITISNGFAISDLSRTVVLDGNYLEIVQPIDAGDTDAPEVASLDVLPSRIHVSAIYYSIALLCLKCLGISQDMGEIQGSKLYYLLGRCLRPDPETREFLYI